MSHVTRASFIVRVVRDRRGRVSGGIERVATGAKEAFMGPEVMGPVIVRMLRRDEPLPPARSWSASPRRPRRGVESPRPGPGTADGGSP